MEKPCVSIIIPVYNVENYLRKCLDSVSRQTLKNIEILCIDDASSDGSLDIINEFAANDPRFVVIPQNREGVGAARNKGIDRASGEYIGFVDSDDYIREDMFEKMYAAAKADDCDLVLCNSELVYGDEPENPPALTSFCTQKSVGNHECSPRLLKELPTHIWSRIIRTSILKTTGIRFPVGVWYEDFCFHYMHYPHCDKVTFIPERLYYYRQRPGSIMNKTRNGKPAKVADSIRVIEDIYQHWNRNGFMASFRPQFLQIYMTSLRFFMSQGPHENQRKEAENAIRFLSEIKLYGGKSDDEELSRFLRKKELKMLRRYYKGSTRLPFSYYWRMFRRKVFGRKKDVFQPKS